MKDVRDKDTVDIEDYIQTQKSQTVGYIRVSTQDQNTARQLQGLKLDKVFTEKVSGATLNRPQLNSMIEYIRQDDTVLVSSLDRLGRDLTDLTKIIEAINKKGASVRFISENLEFSPDKTNPFTKLNFQMLAIFAEYERNIMRVRQREGINNIKSNPKLRAEKYKGRAPKLTSDQILRLNQIVELKKSGLDEWKKITWVQVAKDFGVTKQTIYNYIKKVHN